MPKNLFMGPLRVHAPRVMPSLAAIVADLGSPTADDLAAFLGVSSRTVARWLARGHAPRPAALALFWLTRWGRSQVECSAVNDARLAHAQARAQLAQAQRAADQLRAVLAVADFGSANAPIISTGP